MTNAGLMMALQKFGAPAQVVADVIYRASTDEEPRFRYQCTYACLL